MIQVNRFFLLVLTLALVVVFGHHRPISAQQSLSQDVINAYAEVRANAQIPVKLPSMVPLNAPAASGVNTIWARVRATPDEYMVSFDRAEDCTGVMECSFGSIQGTRLTGNEPPPEQIFEHAVDPNNQKGPVTLANGIDGYFVPYEEGLYLPSTVMWEQNGVRYQAVLYMAAKEDVVAMANSAIQGGD